MKKNIISLFLITQIFAIGGLGFYGGGNYHSTTAASTATGNISISPGPMNNPATLGFFLYLDVLPVIDLEASWELAGGTYPFKVAIDGENIGTSNEFPWVRSSAYFTVRKKIVGVGIPFLAKAQLYGGLGVNTHTVTPDVTVSLIEDAFAEMTPTDAVSQDFSANSTDISILTNYMDKYKRTGTGFHIQVGAQAKLLFVNLFINARYTLAKDVVNGTSGFPTVWTGLAIGL